MKLEITEDDARRLTGLLTIMAIDGNPSFSSKQNNEWLKDFHDRLQLIRGVWK